MPSKIVPTCGLCVRHSVLSGVIVEGTNSIATAKFSSDLLLVSDDFTLLRRLLLPPITPPEPVLIYLPCLTLHFVISITLF